MQKPNPAKQDHQVGTILRAFALMLLYLLLPSHAFGFDLPEQLKRGLQKCTGSSVNEYACAQAIEKRSLANRNGHASRQETTLFIELERKTIKVVDGNSIKPEEAKSHSYLGFISSIHAHVLHVQYYEGSGFMLIHHRTGDLVYPSGYPFISPDKKHFIAISEDMFAGYSPNNIEIWQVSTTGFVEFDSFDLDWGPRSVTWQSPSRATVKKFCYDETHKSPTLLKPCGQALLARTKETWELKE